MCLTGPHCTVNHRTVLLLDQAPLHALLSLHPAHTPVLRKAVAVLSQSHWYAPVRTLAQSVLPRLCALELAATDERLSLTSSATTISGASSEESLSPDQQMV